MTITEKDPLKYKGFSIYNNADWDGRPAPTDIYSNGKKKYWWISDNYDGGNDFGDEDTIEECIEAIEFYLD